jgi:hypothetical protein
MSEPPHLLLAHHLKKLKLPTFLREHEKLARHCAAENLDHTRFLLRLAELELIDRERRMVERRIKAARFPAVKSLDSLDFKAIPMPEPCQSRWPTSVGGRPSHFRRPRAGLIRKRRSAHTSCAGA